MAAPPSKSEDSLVEAEQLYRAGQTRLALNRSATFAELQGDSGRQTRLLILQGAALFELGDVVAALSRLEEAVACASRASERLLFDATFARFVRATDFETPDEALPGLAQLRQLAARIGDVYSISALHLAVARLEGLRGHCVDAHRHLEIARRLSLKVDNEALRCSVDMVDGSLEWLAGNLKRSRALATDCLLRAERSGISKYVVGATTNLAVVCLYLGRSDRARTHLEGLLPSTNEITYVRLGALDSLAQVALYDNRLSQCSELLAECAVVSSNDRLPARSWYELAHQVTRCAYFERLHDWDRVIATASDAEPELVRRKYKALHTSLICAKARAFARMNRQIEADSAISAAVRVCPRGAIDPLIILEASKAVCLAVRGENARAARYFERSIAGCRAIQHRYHEAWITRLRTEVEGSKHKGLPLQPLAGDVADRALVLNDVAAILGAGHAIDLLAHRVVSLVQSGTLDGRVQTETQSGCAYQPEPTATLETSAAGQWHLQLRGSDRLVTIRVDSVRTIDEISLLKGVVDVVQAAVNRTGDVEHEEDDQNLWPRGSVPSGDDAVFRSPQMVEILRVAARLATSGLPILITGETGTGKEILAKFIHEISRAKGGPFVPFNCSATPRDLVESQLFGHRRGAFTGALETFPGVIRSAERGTLFLDEIGDLEPSAQPKLLRFLENGEIHPVGDARPQRVSVRVVAATNADLEQLVEQGRFRRDLLYRIGVARLALPPLRERKDEIPALASLFLARYSRECGRRGLRLADELIAALLLHEWPGNIRELANEVRRLVAMATDGDTITSADLAPAVLRNWNTRPIAPPQMPVPTVHIGLDQSLTLAVKELEERFIDHAMLVTGGRVSEAAQLLGLSRKGLFLKRRRRSALGKTGEG